MARYGDVLLRRPGGAPPPLSPVTARPGSTAHPAAALWRSVTEEVVAGHLEWTGTSAGVDAVHPLIEASERYLAAFESGAAIEQPVPAAAHRVDDPQVAAYLAQVHHRLALARARGDAERAAELGRRCRQFRYASPLWDEMVARYVTYDARYPLHGGGVPRYRTWRPVGGTADPDLGVVGWRLPVTGRVIVLGGVGTGTAMAAAVLRAALSLRPDAIVHLGGVYHSGTGFEFAHRFTGLLHSVFQEAGTRVPVFTVPGDQEYFTGGHAYFDCLDSGALATGTRDRQRASFFCLRSADDGWQFLGMDTGYLGHQVTVGSPGGHAMVALRPDELAWHEDKLRRFPGRTVLLSHHPVFSASVPCGVEQHRVAGPGGLPAPDPADPNRVWVDVALWRQFGPYLGDRVAAWLWGHEHTLNVFADGYRPPGWPPGDPALRAMPKGRCLGHAAVPVRHDQEPYVRRYPVPLLGAVRLGLVDGRYHRGFALLELAGAARPLRASYHEVPGADGSSSCLFTEQIG